MASGNELDGNDGASSSDLGSEFLIGENTPLPAPSEIPSDISGAGDPQTPHHHHHFPEFLEQVHHFYYKDRVEHHSHDKEGNVRVTYTSCTGKRPKLAGTSSRDDPEPFPAARGLSKNDMEIKCVYQLSASDPSGPSDDKVHLFETCVHGARRVPVCAECLGEKRKMRRLL